MPATDRTASRVRAPIGARGAAPRAVGALVALAAAFALAGCEAKGRSPFAQEPSVVHRAPLPSPPGKGRVVTPIPPSAWTSRGLPWPGGFDFGPLARPRRLHPELVTWLGSQPDTARLRVIVGFRDPLRFPRLPIGDVASPDSTLRLSARVTIAHLLDSLRALRRPVARADSAWLTNRFHAKVLESFWITRATLVSIRRDALERLLADRRVRSLEPGLTHERPPSDSPPTSSGRALVGLPSTSRLAALGYDLGPLAFLDTGADPDYPLLKDLESGAVAEDDEPALDRFEHLGTVLQADPAGDVHPPGHGTYSAAILVGTDALGDAFRGATRAHLAMYRIYAGEIGTPPVAEALLRTLQSAAGTAGVIGVSLQIATGIEGAQSDAANQVFASGTAILGVAGNWGEDRLAAPGCARGALAVGARPMEGGLRASSNQSWNKSLRFVAKPELQGPTETGLPRLTDPDQIKTYGETSGALPYVTAAAFVLRNWLEDGRVHVDPGQVYSALLACGENPRVGVSPRFPMREGVGLVNIPSSGTVWWGCVDAGSFSEVRIPLDEAPGGLSARYQAAIWWEDPEPLLSIPRHSDFDLALVSPDGETIYATSATSRGTFERIEVVVPKPLRGLTPSAAPRLRILGRSVGLGSRRVYWTVIGRS